MPYLFISLQGFSFFFGLSFTQIFLIKKKNNIVTRNMCLETLIYTYLVCGRTRPKDKIIRETAPSKVTDVKNSWTLKVWAFKFLYCICGSNCEWANNKENKHGHNEIHSLFVLFGLRTSTSLYSKEVFPYPTPKNWNSIWSQ
jgi:hypothetical protein